MNLFPPVACSVERRTSATIRDDFQRNRRNDSADSVSSVCRSTRLGIRPHIYPHHHPEQQAADRYLYTNKLYFWAEFTHTQQTNTANL